MAIEVERSPIKLIDFGLATYCRQGESLKDAYGNSARLVEEMFLDLLSGTHMYSIPPLFFNPLLMSGWLLSQKTSNGAQAHIVVPALAVAIKWYTHETL